MKKMLFPILLIALISFSTSLLPRNIYSFPDLSRSSKKFNTFMINFQGVEVQSSTFWALCNWQMDLTEFKKTHEKVSGGNAQVVFQKDDQGQSVVLSLWDIFYLEGEEQKVLKADLMYPEGANRNFKGMGSGRNLISDFSWESKKWYTLVIKSWTDVENGNTFVGLWVKDIEAKRWYLISYFDTGLKNSFITGSLSQFQESSDEKTFGNERSFMFTNMYALDIVKKTWFGISKTKLYYDPAYNQAGTHEMEVKDNSFFISSGKQVENQTEYDEENESPVNKTIEVQIRPEVDDVYLKAKASIDSKKTMNISWTVNPKGAPVYFYTIEIKSGHNVIHTYSTTRPDQNTYTYESDFDGMYTVNVKAIGIMDQVGSSSIFVAAQ